VAVRAKASTLPSAASCGPPYARPATHPSDTLDSVRTNQGNGRRTFLSDTDPADQIKRLSELRQQGALTEAEFAAAKAKVLGSGPPTGSGSAPTATGKKQAPKAGCGCLTLVVVVVIIVIIASASGSGGSGNAPTSFTVSDAAVAKLVTNVINNNGNSPGLAKPPSANCTANGSQCSIRYTIKEPAGISAGLELIDPTAQIWKGLFEDSRFQSGVITVLGPLTSVGGQSSAGPLFTLGCNRADDSQIDWNTVDAHGIQTICQFSQLVSSL
jgi:hypothetical protein